MNGTLRNLAWKAGILILFGLLCNASFVLGKKISELPTGVVVPQDPPEVSAFIKPRVSVTIGHNEGEPVLVTGYNIGADTMKVFVKNTGELSRDTTTVCWKELDKDGVVINKNCGVTEEDPVDGIDTTDMIHDVDFKDRTTALEFFVVSHAHPKGQE